MVYLILVDQEDNFTFAGVFSVMEDAFSAGEKSSSHDFRTITDFVELTLVAQVGVYNSIASKFPDLELTMTTGFASKTEANDRITHAISKLTNDEIATLASNVGKKQKKPKKEKTPRMGRSVTGVITLAEAAANEDKIWRKKSLRSQSFELIKEQIKSYNGEMPLASAIAESVSTLHISASQAKAILDKLCAVKVIQITK